MANEPVTLPIKCVDCDKQLGSRMLPSEPHPRTTFSIARCRDCGEAWAKKKAEEAKKEAE